MSGFTRDELRKIFGHLTRLQPPGGRPLTAEELVELDGLLDKTRAAIAAATGNVERGAKILEWRIPRELAPTMNEWGFWEHWKKARARKELDDQLREIIANMPGVLAHGVRTKRWIRVTRFTLQPKKVDDAAIDAIGGKLAIDALVRCGVLAGDTPDLIRREALVAKTSKGNTHLLVEVFCVAQDEVTDPGPLDAPAPQLVRKRGRYTRAITGES